MTEYTAESLAKTLREAIIRFSRRIRQARPVGELTFSQLSALTSLQLHGALTPRELADLERVQPPTMTKIVGKLEDRGLVARTPHPTDGRQVILAATDEGRAVYARNEQVRNEWLAVQLDRLTPEERDTLARAAEIMLRVARA
ncbi:DNA-binding transcriptional regulator, MarR family [Actinoplanes regularis]|uniref:DNA-binding transcriptional regulator, MarR family n=2 Tax=Actinoplanes regularis TaxID=52697 RepID=A0A239CIY8_9ACTN|nr:MarR family transcriptional regulator [Actinoplanes regularis]GIE89365.1 MarR family transcriptional regulator [Actinoplanes regularis]GLW32037.1 MarR family transcriptional regulator [Actinoplanes regularis]SNS19872.1 DNA-binding transcriptional regulator, MarR family [Actinoplanes regularis]